MTSQRSQGATGSSPTGVDRPGGGPGGATRSAEPRPSAARLVGTSDAATPAGRLVRLHPVPVDLAVRAEDSWSDAGRHVIGVQLSRMLGRLPEVLSGSDPEELHAMRVAGRRLRAAWRVFRDAFDPIAVDHFRTELRGVGAVLGAARDLDVRQGLLADYAARRNPSDASRLEPLGAMWRDERRTCAGEVGHLLTSRSFRRLAQELEEFARTDDLLRAHPSQARDATVRTRIGSTVWQAYEGTLAFDGNPARMDLERLHAFRIATKRLRYTLEFVRQPLGTPATRLLRRVVEFQDRLGDVHDLSIAADWAEAFLESTGSRSEVLAVGRFERALRRRSETARRGLPRSWLSMSGPGFRADLGRALASVGGSR